MEITPFEKKLNLIDKNFSQISFFSSLIVLILLFIFQTKALINKNYIDTFDIFRKWIILFSTFGATLFLASLETTNEILISGIYTSILLLKEKNIIVKDFKIFEKILNNLTLFLSNRNTTYIDQYNLEQVFIGENLFKIFDKNYDSNIENKNHGALSPINYKDSSNSLEKKSFFQEISFFNNDFLVQNINLDINFLIAACLFHTCKKDYYNNNMDTNNFESTLLETINKIGINRELLKNFKQIKFITYNKSRFLSLSLCQYQNKGYLFCRGNEKLLENCIFSSEESNKNKIY